MRSFAVLFILSSASVSQRWHAPVVLVSAHEHEGTAAAGDLGQQQQQCSRSLSSLVRELVRTEVLPRMFPTHPSSKDHAQLVPEQCLLHPGNDMFADQERHKVVTSGALHKCLYCNKTFKSDAYLDAHMDRRHTDELRGARDAAGRPNARFCPADLAPLFGVPTAPSSSPSSASLGAADGGAGGGPGCSDRVVERLVHRCRSMARSCFPPSSASATAARDLQGVFEEEVCARIRCQGGIVRGIAGTDVVAAALRGDASVESRLSAYADPDAASAHLAAALRYDEEEEEEEGGGRGRRNKGGVLLFIFTAMVVAVIVIGTLLYVCNRPHVRAALLRTLSPFGSGRGAGSSGSGGNSNSQLRAQRLAGAAAPRGSLARLAQDVRAAVLGGEGKKHS